MSALVKHLVASLPDSFPNLALGDGASLFYIDEHTNDEGRAFPVRVVDARTEGGIDLIEFATQLTAAQLKKLSWCKEQDECLLHFEFTWEQGAFTASNDFGVLLKILSIKVSEGDTEFLLTTRVL